MNKTMDSDFEDQPVSYKLCKGSRLGKLPDSTRSKSFAGKDKAILTAINEKNEEASQGIHARVRCVDKLLANYVGADELKESFA